MSVGLIVKHDYLSIAIKFAEPKGRVTITQGRSGLKLSASGAHPGITNKDFNQLFNTLHRVISRNVEGSNYGQVFDDLKATLDKSNPKTLVDVIATINKMV